ncbi:aminotransferase class III-fold pyridoxal phosphate-dependent enzyme [uncultured Nocardioides sp.]|uniref:aspartate aminotransferase family protein n=1 Tax=uncultured Nocardioides sp. TaxID=198441 RepID=UPI00262D7E12|nr:aminotransferase class III-fold pyridoxal phosphate-dependent enzyme [uncultured Nocardioides sp.]
MSKPALEDAVREQLQAYVDRNPLSSQRQVRAAKAMPGGNTRSILHFDPFPLAFERGEGAFLWSLDGHRYADFLGEFTAGLYGHSEQAILDALRATLERGLSFGGVNDLEPRLAELICARFPSLDLVRFTNSGTEANLMALALAVATTGRRKVLAFRGGYHGGVLTFGETPSPVTVPHEWVLADYDDVAGTRDLLREHGRELAAVLVEPMLGSGGCVPASQEFLEMLRAETSETGTVLIFDEVMTSRLSPGGLQQVTGVLPDLTTLGKYLGGGLSFGAFGGRADLMAAFDPTRPGALFHAGTFNNNVLTMSAGIAGLEQVLDDATLYDVNERGDRLRLALDAVARPAGLHVSGRGSLMTTHAGPPPYLPAAPLSREHALVKELVFFALLERGFWLARRGMVTVSIPVTDALCGELVAAFEDVVGTYQDVLL